MSYALAVDLARGALMLALMLAAPMLLVALAVGLLISVLQAVTQVQEQTLTVVGKLFAVGAVFLLTLPWLLQTAVKYTTELFRSLAGLAS
jgi:flagellar biosynthetic protein FliQ